MTSVHDVGVWCVMYSVWYMMYGIWRIVFNLLTYSDDCIGLYYIVKMFHVKQF